MTADTDSVKREGKRSGNNRGGTSETGQAAKLRDIGPGTEHVNIYKGHQREREDGGHWVFLGGNEGVAYLPPHRNHHEMRGSFGRMSREAESSRTGGYKI